VEDAVADGVGRVALEEIAPNELLEFAPNGWEDAAPKELEGGAPNGE